MRSCSQPSVVSQPTTRSTTQHNNEGAPKPATRSTTSTVTYNIPHLSYKNFKRASELAIFIDSHRKLVLSKWAGLKHKTGLANPKIKNIGPARPYSPMGQTAGRAKIRQKQTDVEFLNFFEKK